MEKLTIHGTPPSAREMIAALSQFRPEVVSVDGHQELVVGLGGDPAELVAALHALEKYLAEQANGPIRLELDGHHYVMHPDGGGA